MKKIDNFENVSEASEIQRMPAGGYVCRVWSVEDVPEKEYLKIQYDIAEGTWKDYAANTMERAGFWPLSMIKSYKKAAAGFFKRFIAAVEKSNGNFVWNWDETALEGRLFGAVVGEEQYTKNSGDIGTRFYVDREMAASRIREGDFSVPELKTLPGHGTTPPAFSSYAERDRSQMTDAEIEELF